MLRRRLLVVTLADASPSDEVAWAARALPWAQAAGLRPVVVLGDLGAWRDRLEGYGPVISADRPDDYAAARFVRWTRAPRGLRPLRWVRARWWRARLRGAGIVALSWPIPEIAARVLPPSLRARAEAPQPPSVLPPAPAPAGPPTVAGVGSLHGDAGADLWLRLAHELRRRGTPATFAWFGAGRDEDRRPFEHERRHLGLDDVVRLHGPDAGETTCELLDAQVLVLSARPGTAGLGALAGALPGARWLAAPGAPPVVGFRGVADGAARCARGEEVPYPDLGAAADAVERALRRGSDAEDRAETLLSLAWAR